MHYVPTSSVSAKLLNSAKAQFEFLINQYFPEAEFYAKEIFTIRLWFWNMNIEVILLHVLYIVHFYLETVSLDQLSHCDSLLLSVFVPVYRALTVFRPAIRYKKITSFFFLINFEYLICPNKWFSIIWPFHAIVTFSTNEINVFFQIICFLPITKEGICTTWRQSIISTLYTVFKRRLYLKGCHLEIWNTYCSSPCVSCLLLLETVSCFFNILSNDWFIRSTLIIDV